MSNDFYNAGGVPAQGAGLSSATIRAEFLAIAAGFDKMPTVTANANKAVVVNSSGTAMTVTAGTLALAGNFATSGASALTLTTTAPTNVTLPTSGTLLSTASVVTPSQGGTGVANNNASTVTITGAFALGITLSAGTSVTFPTSGTLSTLAGAEELTNKTLNASVGKGTWTASGTWTLPAHTIGGAITYGGVTLSNAVTGTGNMVLSASPTLTGTLTGAAANFSGAVSTGALSATTGAFSGKVGVNGAAAGGLTLNLPNAEYIAWYTAGTSGGQVAGIRGNAGNVEIATNSSVTIGGQAIISKAAGTMLQFTDTTASKSIYFNAASGNLDIYTDGPAQQMRVTHVANAVNYLNVRGSTTGNTMFLGPDGSDSNVTFYVQSKGAAELQLATNSTIAVRITTAQGILFPAISTTASAANAFLDSGNSNNLLRSTSVLSSKRDLEFMTYDEARSIVKGSRGFSYASAIKNDPQDRRWLGYGAEWIAEVDERLVHLRDGKPDGVQYERYVVPHGVMLNHHDDDIGALKSWKAKAEVALAKHGITLQ